MVQFSLIPRGVCTFFAPPGKKTTEDKLNQKDDVRLTDYFGAESVLPHCGDMVRDDVVRTLVGKIVAGGGVPVGADELVSEVLAREALGTTVVRDGLAVPHARVEGLKEPCVAVATSVRGIDWPGEHQGKVHIVFLMLIPREDPALYLKVLRALGTALKDPEDFNLVAGMTSAGEIYRFFKNGQAYLPRFLTAADFVTSDYKAIRDTDSLQICISALIAGRTSELAVVDAAGNLKGVARADNILRACIPEHFLWMDDLSSILDFEPFVQVLDDEHSTPVTTILDEKYPVVSPDSPAVQVACEMMKYKSSKCYVRDGDRFVGVVKLTEFLNKVFRE